MNKVISIRTENRSCGDCTLCCEGHLTLDVYGIKVHSGNPCHYVNKNGCTVYEKRPEVCSKFKCEWLRNLAVPEWMKPNLVNVIIKSNEIDGMPYIELVEAGKTMNIRVLNYFVQRHARANINMGYQIENQWYFLGTDSFMTAIKNKFGEK